MSLLKVPGARRPSEVLRTLPLQRTHAIQHAERLTNSACAAVCSCGKTDAAADWDALFDRLSDHRLFHSITEGVA